MPADQPPWARVRNPATLPTPMEPGPLLALSDEEFEELVRGHLMPREDQPGGRKRWSLLWALLMNDEELSERTFDVLEEFLDTTEEAIEDLDLDPAEASRAVKFKGRCEEAWKRLQHGDDGRPLAWAGHAADGFNPLSRRVIATLIGAISRHRSTVLRSGQEVTATDQALWDSMGAVRLDPRSYHYRER